MVRMISYPEHDAVPVFVYDPHEHIQRYWLGGNFYEVQHRGLLNRVYVNHGPGLVYLDVGASIGNHTVFFGEVMEAEHVYAVEPCPFSFSHLQANVGLQFDPSRYTLLHRAAGNSAGTVGISQYGDGSNVGMKKIVEGNDVLMERIDDMLPDVRVDVVKIDIEGYNMPALDGAVDLLRRCRPVVYIECPTMDDRNNADRFFREVGFSRCGEQMNHTATWEYRCLK